MTLRRRYEARHIYVYPDNTPSSILAAWKFDLPASGSNHELMASFWRVASDLYSRLLQYRPRFRTERIWISEAAIHYPIDYAY